MVAECLWRERLNRSNGSDESGRALFWCWLQSFWFLYYWVKAINRWDFNFADALWSRSACFAPQSDSMLDQIAIIRLSLILNKAMTHRNPSAPMFCCWWPSTGPSNRSLFPSLLYSQVSNVAVYWRYSGYTPIRWIQTQKRNTKHTKTLANTT